MAAIIRWYDRATLYVANSTYGNLAVQPITVALLTSSYTFSASHVVYADLTNELPSSGGYTQPGQAISSLLLTQATTVTNLTGQNVTWTASGGGIGAFRYAVAYINATVNGIVKPLLFAVDNNGVDIGATTAPNPLTVSWNATGIAQIAHS